MDAIQTLIAIYDWNFQCWQDRYGRGIWAVVAPLAIHTHEIREITDGGDIESMELGNYFSDEGAWLSVANGTELAEVIEQLNRHVKPFVENETWRARVSLAFERITELNDGNYGLRIAVQNKEATLLKPTHL